MHLADPGDTKLPRWEYEITGRIKVTDLHHYNRQQYKNALSFSYEIFALSSAVKADLERFVLFFLKRNSIKRAVPGAC